MSASLPLIEQGKLREDGDDSGWRIGFRR